MKKKKKKKKIKKRKRKTKKEKNKIELNEGKGGSGSPLFSGGFILYSIFFTISTSIGFKNTFMKENLSNIIF